MHELEIGKGECLKQGNDIAVLTIGTMATPAEKAIEKIEKEQNISIAHYDLRFLKPLDEALLHEIAEKFNQIITIEDGVIQGGFGSAVLEFMSDNNYNIQIKRLGIPDNFVEHGSPEELYKMLGLDENGIASSILGVLKGTKSIRFQSAHKAV
jgi:1-deoxy-D-xylulose-5-phosphate synthase